ncbi:hypothetical protein [Micromonospora sp. KLBMP9576]|uniref:hypothetical protein n=1 Tax=Micromonospora sp. KLBMP9576 TaxID=3424769 RepID=UPI003D8C0CE1
MDPTASEETLHRELLDDHPRVLVVAGPRSCLAGAVAVLDAGPLGELPAGAGTAARGAQAPVSSVGGVNLRTDPRAESAWLVAGGRGFPESAPRGAAFAVLAALFSGDTDSVFRRTLDDIGVAGHLHAAQTGCVDTLWAVDLELPAPQVAAAESMLRETLELVRAGRLAERDIRAARESVAARYGAERADPLRMGHRAACALLNPEPGTPDDDPERWVAAVTPDDLAEAARQVLGSYVVTVS